MSYHLAQLNIARPVAALDDPVMAGFTGRLDEINRLAESSPGFIWRLKDDSGYATNIRAFDDPSLLINLSVWQSIEALADFTYRTSHTELLRQRHSWFQRSEQAMVALWWIGAGHIPTLDEARDRLELLRQNGPTPQSFTFGTRFPPPTD